MEKMESGTTTLGIVCKDGIILATDKRTTWGGQFIVRKDAEKLNQISDNIAITTAGSVSDIQMFIKLMKAELKLRNLRTNRPMSVKEAANLASRIMYDGARTYFPNMTQVLMGGYDNSGFYLFEIDVDGACMLYKDYFSTGSGSIVVFGVLEHAYKDGMTVKEGEDLAVKAVSAAIQRDPASGNGIDVMMITKDGMRKTVQKKIQNVYVDR